LILCWFQDSWACKRCSENNAVQFMNKRDHLLAETHGGVAVCSHQKGALGCYCSLGH
jgi:hypothetical protein